MYLWGSGSGVDKVILMWTWSVSKRLQTLRDHKKDIHTCLACLRMLAQCQSDGQRAKDNNDRDTQSSFPRPGAKEGSRHLCFFTLHSPEESHLTTQTVTATLKSPQQAQGIRKSIPTVVALHLQQFEWTAGLPRTAHERLKLFYSQ